MRKEVALGILGDIAREGAVDEIAEMIDKKIDENKRSKKTVKVLQELKNEIYNVLPYYVPPIR